MNILTVDTQGPRSNFDIGEGGAPLVSQYWGRGGEDTVFYYLFIILKLLGAPPGPPTARSLTQ